MEMRRPRADAEHMKKRALAAMLWFYSAWYVGAMIAELFGLSPALGPILGTAAAAIIAGDPRGIIWTRPTPAAVSTGSGSTPAGQRMQNPV